MRNELKANKVVDGLWQDHGLVFTTQVGTPINRHKFYARNFKLLLERADLPRTVRFHDLRHNCATLLLSKNVNPKILQDTLGHASLSMTLGIYSHVQAAMKDEAAAAMDATFSLGGKCKSARHSRRALFLFCFLPADPEEK